MLSYWQKQFFSHKLDIAIVGGGLNGLLAAIFLKKDQPKLRIAIFEKGFLPDGASLRNAGFACFGSVSELNDDLRFSPLDEVLQLVKNRYEGLQLLRQLSGSTEIGYEASGGYEFFTPNDENLYQESAEKISFWNQALSDIIPLKKVFSVYDGNPQQIGLPPKAKLILNPHEGALHSNLLLQRLHQLAMQFEIPLYFGFDYKSHSGHADKVEICFKNEINLYAKRLLFCTNGYLPLHENVEMKPARGQVLITEPIKDLKLKGVFHHQAGYNYFRELDGRILLGGGRFLDPEGETDNEHSLHEKIQDYLEGLLYSFLLPDSTIKIERRWSGIMSFGKNKKPLITQIEDKVWFAGRMGGMGVALAASTAQKTAQMLKESF